MHSLALLCVFIAAASTVLAVWPDPANFTRGETVAWLSPRLRFIYRRGGNTIYDDGWTPLANHPTDHQRLMEVLGPQWTAKDDVHATSEISVNEMLIKAIKRTKKDLRNIKFVPWKFHPRHEAFQPNMLNKIATIRELIIKEKPSEEASRGRDYLHGDESYEIKVTKKGKAAILAKSPIGTLRALQTLPQLFYAHSSGGIYTPYAPVSIVDAPTWPYRGLNLDIARNPISPSDVKRTIDAMASVKLNRLHIHATDSQSWPLEIPSIPFLASRGAYHISAVWSPSQLRNVQIYGLERGVSTFIEIDMPGHTGSIWHSYPELVLAFEKENWDRYVAEPPSGQIRLNDPTTRKFVDTIIADLLPRVSPYSRYFHTGGDEFNLETYMLEDSIRSKDPNVLRPFLQTFIYRLHKQIMKAGLTPIVWEDLVLDWSLTFPTPEREEQRVIVQAWRNSDSLKEILERGHRAIFGTGDAWYLDCGLGGIVNPRRGSDAVKDPYLDWCSPTKNWRHIYMHNPLANISTELHSLIQGGEAHMWTENVDPVNMDQTIWPRAAAAAEVLWGGPRIRDDIQWASYRLGEWRERAVLDMGVNASPAQMTYCLMQEGTCEL